MSNRSFVALGALTLAIAACSPRHDPAANQTAATPTPMPSPAPTPRPTASPRIIGLEGLGALTIDRPVPANAGWAERGGQVDGPCRIIGSRDYPGVYAIVEGGKVARISVGKGSDVKLVEGIGVGATEKQVRGWFGGFREEAHKYEEAPAKYLTAPNAPSGDPALRFEIGQDDRVQAIHVGTMPVLGYVEGCA